jgi:hypothetical protein
MDLKIILIVLLICICIYLLYKLNEKMNILDTKIMALDDKFIQDTDKDTKKISQEIVRDIKKANMDTFMQYQKIITLNNQPVIRKTNYFCDSYDASANNKNISETNEKNEESLYMSNSELKINVIDTEKKTTPTASCASSNNNINIDVNKIILDKQEADIMEHLIKNNNNSDIESITLGTKNNKNTDNDTIATINTIQTEKAPMKTLVIKDIDVSQINNDTLRPVNEYHNDAIKKMAKHFNVKITGDNGKLLKKDILYGKIKIQLQNT